MPSRRRCTARSRGDTRTDIQTGKREVRGQPTTQSPAVDRDHDAARRQVRGRGSECRRSARPRPPSVQHRRLLARRAPALAGGRAAAAPRSIGAGRASSPAMPPAPASGEARDQQRQDHPVVTVSPGPAATRRRQAARTTAAKQRGHACRPPHVGRSICVRRQQYRAGLPDAAAEQRRSPASA